MRAMKHALMDPISLALDWRTGRLEPATTAIRRHLSNMRGMYADAAAEQALIADGDPLIYEVLLHDVPGVAGQLLTWPEQAVHDPGAELVGDESRGAFPPDWFKAAAHTSPPSWPGLHLDEP